MALVVTFHVLIVTLVNSPTSIHFLLLVSLLTYVSLNTILQPRIQYSEQAGPGAASAVAGMYMFAVAMYFIAVGYIASNVSHDPSSFKLETVAAVAFVDCFLLVMGHTWDMQPSFTTILNCRLLYATFVGVMNITAYVFWHSLYRVHYFDTGKAKL